MSDRIEINFDDEGKQPEAAYQKPLVITSEDLLNVPDTPRSPMPQKPPPGYTATPGQEWQYQKKSGASAVSGRSVIQGAIAGLIGGFIAWAITEVLFDYNTARSFPLILIEMGAFGGIIGGVIGCCLGAADGVTSGVWEKALKAGGIGLGIGAAGGFLGGVFGQLIYGSLYSSAQSSLGTTMVARTIGWSVVGIFVGLGQGVGRGSGKRIINGLIGGLAGGFVAGFLFDPIGLVVHTGLASRLVGISILGCASGLAVGLVEEMRKEAWLSVVQGPLSGKQFILYEAITRIGSSPKCEITLIKDPQMMPEHAIIENRGSSFVLTSRQGPALVNGHPANQTRLQAGTIIAMGSTSLLFEEKAIGR